MTSITVQRILGSEKASIEKAAERPAFESWEIMNNEKVKGKRSILEEFDLKDGEFSPGKGAISTPNVKNIS